MTNATQNIDWTKGIMAAQRALSVDYTESDYLPTFEQVAGQCHAPMTYAEQVREESLATRMDIVAEKKAARIARYSPKNRRQTKVRIACSNAIDWSWEQGRDSKRPKLANRAATRQSYDATDMTAAIQKSVARMEKRILTCHERIRVSNASDLQRGSDLAASKILREELWDTIHESYHTIETMPDCGSFPQRNRQRVSVELTRAEEARAYVDAIDWEATA